jgi:hypothetical protein
MITVVGLAIIRTLCCLFFVLALSSVLSVIDQKFRTGPLHFKALISNGVGLHFDLLPNPKDGLFIFLQIALAIFPLLFIPYFESTHFSISSGNQEGTEFLVLVLAILIERALRLVHSKTLLRSSLSLHAQILSIIVIVLLGMSIVACFETTSLQAIMNAQSGTWKYLIPSWGIVRLPLMALALGLYLVSLESGPELKAKDQGCIFLIDRFHYLSLVILFVCLFLGGNQLSVLWSYPVSYSPGLIPIFQIVSFLTKVLIVHALIVAFRMRSARLIGVQKVQFLLTCVVLLSTIGAVVELVKT